MGELREIWAIECSKFSWTTAGVSSTNAQPCPCGTKNGGLLGVVLRFLPDFFPQWILEFSLPRGFRYPMTGGLSCRSSANRGGAVLRHGRISRSRTWCLGTGLSSLRSFVACFRELDHKMVGQKLEQIGRWIRDVPIFDTKPGGFAPQKMEKCSTRSWKSSIDPISLEHYFSKAGGLQP